jgi:hypothetical protein
MTRRVRRGRRRGGARGGADGFVDEGDDVALDPPSPELRAALEAIRDRFERSWCDEPVPALGGLTPRAAVADPVTRAEVVRLLATFPDVDDELVVDGRLGAAMRPARLRELLGLDPA